MEFKDKGKPKEGARHDPQHDLPQRLRLEAGEVDLAMPQRVNLSERSSASRRRCH